MLPAVRLQNQSMGDTGKVYDEWTNRMLPAEFQAGQPSRTQQAPKQLFGIGHPLPQGAGVTIGHAGNLIRSHEQQVNAARRMNLPPQSVLQTGAIQ